jgi:hypothetical protein
MQSGNSTSDQLVSTRELVFGSDSGVRARAFASFCSHPTRKTLAHIQCVEFIDAPDMARVINSCASFGSVGTTLVVHGRKDGLSRHWFILWPVLME